MLHSQVWAVLIMKRKDPLTYTACCIVVFPQTYLVVLIGTECKELANMMVLTFQCDGFWLHVRLGAKALVPFRTSKSALHGPRPRRPALIYTPVLSQLDLP